MKQNGEPSVEEILASIKQVIARDTRVPIEPARREAACRADAEQRATARAGAEEDDVLDLPESARIDAAEPDEAPLLTEDARSSMRESLAALAAISGPGTMPQIVRSGETSLEGLVRDLLRPALSDWLDKNLPAIVEKLVAAEIARIVGKKG